jgi:predicted TIM-barrel fold metal-dependent hydrolase/glyoxylase-like metal-dependent hydrolase (beta-lactamase superfamily II)
VNRRAFIGGAAAGLASTRASAQTPAIPVIDSHIHLFDISRPQGVPWPPKDNPVLYQSALPARYRKLATPHGVVGAIEVECSPWFEDNQWVLDTMATDEIMLGMVGNLEPGKPEFGRQLERFRRNPMFLGIRCGNLWGRNLAAEIAKPDFMAGMKALADAGLELDTANQNAELLQAALRVSDRVPNLRIVIDHLPQMQPRDAKAHQATLRELGKRPQIYVKVSEVLRRVNGRVPMDLAFYRARLDEICGAFGPDRVIFGSDWPNSDTWAPYDQVFKIVHDYFTAKGPEQAEKYFWKNSQAAYRWKRRNAEVKRWSVITIGNLSRNRYFGESDEKALRSAICTSTVVSGQGFHLLIDPSLASRAEMARELDRRTGLKPDDITAVFVTHEHGDHFAGIEHFEKASWYAAAPVAAILNQKGWKRSVETAPGTLFGAVEVMATPGHTQSHHSLCFECEGRSVVAAGDSVATRDYWRERRSYYNAVDPALAAKTMDRLAEAAEIIIPGHDNYFFV